MYAICCAHRCEAQIGDDEPLGCRAFPLAFVSGYARCHGVDARLESFDGIANG